MYTIPHTILSCNQLSRADHRKTQDERMPLKDPIGQANKQCLASGMARRLLILKEFKPDETI
jgi:hypothetical protein